MGKQERETQREPNPLEAHAERDTAIGYMEIPCKGGPDSIFVRVEMPVSEALGRATHTFGPDRRAVLVKGVVYRMEHGS